MAQFTQIKMPNASSNGFASGLQEMVDNINRNFLLLNELPLSKGDKGDSMAYFRYNPNLLLENILKELTLSTDPNRQKYQAILEEAMDNYTDWCATRHLNPEVEDNKNTYKAEVRQEFRKIISAIRQEFDSKAERSLPADKIRDLFVEFNYKGEEYKYELCWMADWFNGTNTRDKALVMKYILEYKFPSLVVFGLLADDVFKPLGCLSYSFIDTRWRNPRVNNYAQIVSDRDESKIPSYQSLAQITDHSCVVYGDMEDREFVYKVVDAYPRLRYTPDGVTMVINGHDTGTSAGGQKGNDGRDANLFLVQRMENVEYTTIKQEVIPSGDTSVWQVPMGALTKTNGITQKYASTGTAHNISDMDYNTLFKYSTDGRVVLSEDETYMPSQWLKETMTIDGIQYKRTGNLADSFKDNYYRVWGISGGTIFWTKNDTGIVPITSNDASFETLSGLNGAPCIVTPAFEHRANEFMTYFWLSTITLVKYTSDTTGDTLYIPVVYCGSDNLINLAMDNTSFAGLMMALDPYEQRYINETFPRRHRPRGLMVPIGSRWAQKDEERFASHIIYSDSSRANWQSISRGLRAADDSPTNGYVANKNILHIGSIQDYRTLDDIHSKTAPAVPGRAASNVNTVANVNSNMYKGSALHVDEPVTITMYRDTIDGIKDNALLTVEGDVIIGARVHYNDDINGLMHVDRSGVGGGIDVQGILRTDTSEKPLTYKDKSKLNNETFEGGNISIQALTGMVSQWVGAQFIRIGDDTNYLTYDRGILRSAGRYAIFDFDAIQLSPRDNNGKDTISSTITPLKGESGIGAGLRFGMTKDNGIISKYIFDIDSTLFNGGVVANGYPDGVVSNTHQWRYSMEALNGLYVDGVAVDAALPTKYRGNRTLIFDEFAPANRPKWPRFNDNFAGNKITLFNNGGLYSTGAIWTDKYLHVGGVEPSAILLGSGNYTLGVVQTGGNTYYGDPGYKNIAVNQSPIVLDLGPTYKKNRLVKFALVDSIEDSDPAKYSITKNNTPTGKIFLGQWPKMDSGMGDGGVSENNFMPDNVGDAGCIMYSPIMDNVIDSVSGSKDASSQYFGYCAFESSRTAADTLPKVFWPKGKKPEPAKVKYMPANAWRVTYKNTGEMVHVKLYILCAAITSNSWNKHGTGFRKSKVHYTSSGLGIVGFPEMTWGQSAYYGSWYQGDKDGGSYMGSPYNSITRGHTTDQGFAGLMPTNAALPEGVPVPMEPVVAQWSSIFPYNARRGTDDARRGNVFSHEHLEDSPAADGGIVIKLGTDGRFYVTNAYRPFYMFEESQDMFRGRNGIEMPYIELNFAYPSTTNLADAVDQTEYIKAWVYKVNIAGDVPRISDTSTDQKGGTDEHNNVAPNGIPDIFDNHRSASILGSLSALDKYPTYEYITTDALGNKLATPKLRINGDEYNVGVWDVILIGYTTNKTYVPHNNNPWADTTLTWQTIVKREDELVDTYIGTTAKWETGKAMSNYHPTIINTTPTYNQVEKWLLNDLDNMNGAPGWAGSWRKYAGASGYTAIYKFSRYKSDGGLLNPNELTNAALKYDTIYAPAGIEFDTLAAPRLFAYGHIHPLLGTHGKVGANNGSWTADTIINGFSAQYGAEAYWEGQIAQGFTMTVRIGEWQAYPGTQSLGSGGGAWCYAVAIRDDATGKILSSEDIKDLIFMVTPDITNGYRNNHPNNMAGSWISIAGVITEEKCALKNWKVNTPDNLRASRNTFTFIIVSTDAEPLTVDAGELRDVYFRIEAIG